MRTETDIELEYKSVLSAGYSVAAYLLENREAQLRASA